MNVIIIPARMESSRLPNKPLLSVCGKSLLQWTYEAAHQVYNADLVFVAIPEGNQPLIKHCIGHRIPYVETSPDLPNGTARCREAALKLIELGIFRESVGRGIDVVVNWQVDEPLVKPEQVRRLIGNMRSKDIWTLTSPMIDGDAERSDVVKVIVNRHSSVCHWFSRSGMASALNHIGVYAFDLRVLKYMGNLEQTYHSKAENLEQLTWIEFGCRMFGQIIDAQCFGINTMKDLDDFRKIKE